MNITNPLAAVKTAILPSVYSIFGENLASVILYGSAAGNSFNPKLSDINLLLLVEKNDYTALADLGKKVRAAAKKYKVSFMIMTVSGFLSSADVFPMEYIDIKEHHVILFGDDITEKLEITGANLRHQIEEKLCGLCNITQQLILTTGGNKTVLKANLKGLYPAVKTVVRAALRLKGKDVKNFTDTDIFSEAKYVFDAEFPSAFINFHEESLPTSVSSFDITSEVLENIDKIAAHIDAMGK